MDLTPLLLLHLEIMLYPMMDLDIPLYKQMQLLLELIISIHHSFAQLQAILLLFQVIQSLTSQTMIHSTP